MFEKFRSCNLPLAIETGRFTRPNLPDLNDFVHTVLQTQLRMIPFFG